MYSLLAAGSEASADSPLILIVAPSWVGDMVMSQSLFRLLKGRSPEPGIQVIAPPWSRPLLERMPEVEAAIDLPLGHGRLGLSQRRQLAMRLRGRAYTQAIVLPNSWKSALVPYWARVPLRTGWRGEWRYGLLNDLRQLRPKDLPMMVQRFVALGVARGEPSPERLPVPRLEIQASQVGGALRQRSLTRHAQRPLLALCPGAEYGPAKRWPAEHFGELARVRQGEGWDVWLFGSEQDRPVCAQVNEAAGGGCVDLSGRTTLAQAVDLLSLADAVVSNDSGLMHVAAALGHPLVSLFGSSDPAHTPPLSNRAQVLSLRLPCSPCFKRECPLGHLDCLRQLPVEQVLAALDALEA
jgi:lipopolysaccharide heptosyltransferase II